jgi:endonuclease YncB( thermonuclease family)
MIRALIIVALGAASFAGVYYFVAPAAEEAALPPPPSLDIAPIDVASVPAIAPDPLESMTFELRPGAETLPDSFEPAHAVRNVTPDYITAGPTITGTLARVAPPARAIEPPKARAERVFNAIVVSAGTIKVRGRDIRLADVAAPDFDTHCGEGAAAWPCGRMARAALRSFLRGRAIECEIPAGADDLPDSASCSVSGQSISEWLVTQGWAKRTGDAYEAAEFEAREAKLGVWSEKRPDGQAEVATNG